jgi:hypothetical protein
MGWGPLDLFGCDRERPIARLDHAGLIWLLDGRSLHQLDHHQAVISLPNGGTQTYRRRPVESGSVVLAWELAKEH